MHLQYYLIFITTLYLLLANMYVEINIINSFKVGCI